jgi:hypothetical protein
LIIGTITGVAPKGTTELPQITVTLQEDGKKLDLAWNETFSDVATLKGLQISGVTQLHGAYAIAYPFDELQNPTFTLTVKSSLVSFEINPSSAALQDAIEQRLDLTVVSRSFRP